MMDPNVKVKTERPDEAEIRELAAKMVEANKAKALAASVAAARPPPGAMMGAPPGVGGQMGILNFLTRKPGAAGATVEQRPAGDAEKKVPAPDEASWKGHFGWDMLGKCHIPYIFRSGEKYVAVRMVEIKLLNKYLNYLHADIYSCTCIRSYYITELEARLLNDINNRHCDGQFGRELFTQKDLVVRLSDAYEFYNFLDVCYYKLLRGSTNSKDKCGFIRINKESVVPYTVRDNQKFVPLFYFEGETDNLKLKADQLKGWDLSYLKFCCKVQGIRNELFASETCSVISLSDIRSYFPPGTEFEEYWPNKVVDSQLLISAKGSVSGGGQWTRAPPAPPPGVVGVSNTAGVNLNSVGGQSNRGRRATTQRHTNAAAAMQMPHAGLSAATVQALTNGWNLPGTLTQAQTQQVLRIAQAQVAAQAQAQAQVAAARYNTAALAAAAALPQHRTQSQRTVQFPNSAITMAMGQQPPPPLVRSSANTNTMKERKENKKERNREYQRAWRQRKKDLKKKDSKKEKEEGKRKRHRENQRAYYQRTKGLKENDKNVEELFQKKSDDLQIERKEKNKERNREYQRAWRQRKKALKKKVSKEEKEEEKRKRHRENQRAYYQRTKGLKENDKNVEELFQKKSDDLQIVPPPASGTMNGQSTSHSVDSRRRLTPIPDITISGNHTPYKVQKALVENTMVPCINAKPYQYTELLMTLPDLASHFFPRVPLPTCRAMLDALGITLFRPNSTQLQVLRNSGKCKSAAAGENGTALVQIRDVMQHMPQFNYMLRSGPATEEPQPRPAHAQPQAKRARAN